jgi:hypothetical protein
MLHVSAVQGSTWVSHAMLLRMSQEFVSLLLLKLLVIEFTKQRACMHLAPNLLLLCHTPAG